MTQTERTPVASRRRGSGTQRERRPGVLEVRVPAMAVGLAAMEVPMTFIGCTDSPIPIEAVLRTAELAPPAEVEVLEGVGHFPWLEQRGLVMPLWTVWRDVPT